MNARDRKALAWMNRYLRFCDYLGAAQLYLQDNFWLKEPLAAEHIKPRILGHWGTVPGLNFIYANLNYLVAKHDAEFLLVTGPGHGAPSILANLFAEGTLGSFYPDFKRNAAGFSRLVHDFSWPHSKFPSHVTPTVPGSILEGGELGYSLGTAYGAVMDNPNLIAVAVVGDGEAETGPIAAAWHSNKFLNPRVSGAVLPIVHINGYKISNPTLFGRMDDAELLALFTGYGYEPLIVSEPHLEESMLEAMEQAYQRIRSIQKKARASTKLLLKPKWPVILLRSAKGWHGLKRFDGKAIEGSFRSHGVPLGHPREDAAERAAIEKWLKSYRVQELLNSKGELLPEVLEFVPTGAKRIGMSKYALGGERVKALKLPPLTEYQVKFKKTKGVLERGFDGVNSMQTGAPFLRDLIRKNPTNFRVFCPDELESNMLGALFEASGRGFQWPLQPNDEHMQPEKGRILEMLSEHTLQAWKMGYTLTGRFGFFPSYEAFLTIIASMVDQYAKFLKQSFKVSWRKPVPPLVYLLTSVGWRQDHNGYSHQNPSFVSNLLQKHGEFCQIYYPADANSFLVAMEEVFQKRNAICAIVAGKRNVPQWLTLAEAREQAKTGMAIWEWATGKEATQKPDVVLASAGDYMTQEALHAIQLCREWVPELKIRYVNVSELSSFCLGDACPVQSPRLTQDKLDDLFTSDKPVVFNYHGYVTDLEHILWPYVRSDRFSLHGYRERGSTTTPFDLKVTNEVDFYHLAMDLITQGAKSNRKVAAKQADLLARLEAKIVEHQRHICEVGDDPTEVKILRWEN